MLKPKEVEYPENIPRSKYELMVEGERVEYLGKPPDQRTRTVKIMTRTRVYHAKCPICNHEHKDEINRLLTEGKSIDEVVSTFQVVPIIRKFLSEHIAAGHLDSEDNGWIFWYHADNVQGGKVFVHWSEETQSFFRKT